MKDGWSSQVPKFDNIHKTYVLRSLEHADLGGSQLGTVEFVERFRRQKLDLVFITDGVEKLVTSHGLST